MNVKYPNLWQSILLFVLLAAIYITLQVVMELAFYVTVSKNSANSLLVGTISSIIAFSVVIAAAITWFETNLYAYLESAPVKIKIVIPLAVMFIGLQIATSEFDNLMRYLIKPSHKWIEQLHRTLIGTHPIILFISLVIVAPITEEFFFRGMLLRGMLKNHNYKIALISSAIMFGLIHFNPIMMLPAMIIGFFLGWIFILTGSLWCCFFCHAVNNLIVFIAVLLNIELAGYANFKSSLYEVSFQPLWLDTLGLFMLITGTYFTNKIAKEYKDSPHSSSNNSVIK